MTTRKPDDKAETNRRGFLRLAGLGTVTAGATLASGETAEAATQTDATDGYRETDHIRAYYDSARF